MPVSPRDRTRLSTPGRGDGFHLTWTGPLGAGGITCFVTDFFVAPAPPEAAPGPA
ncbi:hypothetical protein [Streptomyces cyanogenus]|uniref:Uncharacterized protein n=1 Tax=Streptomyces cyanogenus TaxID=80860 RepID=A0ABX7TWH2_STRCY|nr:hypothetical protein [Streptomyces cyanogenus]QTE01125.1 hypothetical protein S1361_27580 [Streptomyces cyanogenus]